MHKEINVLRRYYHLTKPGIIYGNLLTAVGGFMLASRGQISIRLLIAMAVGTSLVVASACVVNNYLDRGIDAKMARTRKRAIVLGDVSTENALTYAAILGAVGLATLARYTNTATLTLGLIGFFSYVVLYTFSKRYTVHGTLIGSISGATPIAAGYTAAAGRFDVVALMLFVIMVIWQMPHFYAIAMYRRDDYAAAGIPVLAVVRGMHASKIQIVIYTALFAVAAAALALYGHASFSYFVIMVCFSLYWLWLGLRGFKKGIDDASWARKMFGTSLLVVLAFSIMLSLDAWLP